jgi:hypothetical protein
MPCSAFAFDYKRVLPPSSYSSVRDASFVTCSATRRVYALERTTHATRSRGARRAVWMHVVSTEEAV